MHKKMESTEKHLVFRIKKQQFTVNVAFVNTIIQLPEVFVVPQAPDYILGVINLEGNVIPVVKTGIKLNMGEITTNDQSQVIILQHDIAGDIKTLGFLVEDVNDVVDIDPLKIQPLPTSKYEFDERLVDGMHKVQDEFCMQVNIPNFFKGEIEELLNQK